MPEKDTNKRYTEYVNDQVERVHAFKDAYEAQHNTELGDYPFTVEGKYPVPNISVQQDLDVANDHEARLYALIENDIHNHIITEAVAQTEDPQYRETYRNLQELGGGSDFSEQLRGKVTQAQLNSKSDPSVRLAFDSDGNPDIALHNILDALEQKGDHPTLAFAKELSNKGVTLTPSPDEVQLKNVQSDMENHYAKHVRPSQQMEQLINKAENEARTLDRTLDQILELEAQGVENPLNEPKVVEAAPKQSNREYELLKALLRKKQPVAAKDTQQAKDPSLDADL